MNRILAALQVGLALILFVIAIGTMINMVLIAVRPETISVVNVFIGQIVLIVCMAALGRILLKRGLTKFSSIEEAQSSAAADKDQSKA